MKKRLYIFLIILGIYSNVHSQTINIHSITTSRQSTGDNGYTLDGQRMTSGARQKLLNSANFGVSGTYSKNIAIFDGYGTTGSLTQITNVPTENIFFFGSFNQLSASTQQFTSAEIDSLYNWSKRGGKLIIASGGTYSNFYDANILDNKWGYNYVPQAQSNFIPTVNGNNTDIFNGPFGSVIAANQGGAAQGYFSALTNNSKVLATDINGNTTLFMDCNTLDLIVADIDGYTDLGGITSGSTVNNSQDKFWSNTIVFMDKLQPLPILFNNSGTLSLNATYNNYQWFQNSNPISNDSVFNIVEAGTYYVEVELNGGCKVKSDTIIVKLSEPILLMPNVFTPNNDGINDFFRPIKKNGIKNATIAIFNGWGNRVFESSDITTGWDGQCNEKHCSDGVYYWVVRYIGQNELEQELTGNLTLLR